MTNNTFTPELLEQNFTLNEWKKGTRIFQNKGVKTCALDGETIRGVVFSERSRQDSYLTRLIFNNKSGVIASYCDCYIGRDCKHGAALAQCFILQNFDEKSTASSEKVIEKWIRSFSSSTESV